MQAEALVSDRTMYPSIKPAVVAGRIRLSHGDLHRMSDGFAAAIASRGVSRGDRMVVFMDSGWECVVALLGMLKAGAVFVPVDPDVDGEELARLLNRIQAAALVTQPRLAGLAARALANAASVRLAVLTGGDASRGVQDYGCLRFEDAIRTAAPATLPNGQGSEDEPALLLHLGSEAMTRGELATAAASAALQRQMRQDDSIVLALPLTDRFGICQMMAAVQTGATLILGEPFGRTKPTAAFRIEAGRPGSWPTHHSSSAAIPAGLQG